MNTAVTDMFGIDFPLSERRAKDVYLDLLAETLDTVAALKKVFDS